MKNILIVDDALFARRFLTGEVEKVDNLTVAATARNGVEAMKVLTEEKIDLVLLDLDMPVMDGFKTMEKMKEQGIEVPVLVVSALTVRESDTVVRVLEQGAVEVLPKPDKDMIGAETDKISEELHKKLAALVSELPEQDQVREQIQAKQEENRVEKFTTVSPRLLVIGGSTGAPSWIYEITSHLPADFSLPVVIIQHMREMFFESMGKILRRRSPLSVELVTAREKLEAGKIYLPSVRKQLRFQQHEESVYIQLRGEDKVSGVCPSVDVTFESAAEVFGADVISVLLTGMGKDGAAGMEMLSEAGALCLGQDQESSAVYGMPREAAARGALDLQAPGGEIPEIITDWVERTREG